MCETNGGAYIAPRPQQTTRPEAELARLLERRVGLPTNLIDDRMLERLIQSDWSKVAALAHAIHDEKKTKLRTAAGNIGALDVDGIVNVIEGRAAAGLAESFLIIADAIRGRRPSNVVSRA